MKQKKFTFIDLFAGLGGFHLALQGLGGKCVFASEIKEDLKKFYQMNFPDTTIEGDITQIPVESIPAHDVLCAGFPCQPFSQAGKRQGFNDDKNRGNLFDYICEIIRYHRPKYIILENVANLKGHDGGNTWRVIQEKLDALDYHVKDEILSPHQFGIPQHRKRIYIVCIDKKCGNLDYFQFPITSRKISCNINKIIDPTDTNIIKIKPETRYQLEVWQEFIDKTIETDKKLPGFPIWAMEFGATYDYKCLAPAYQALSNLNGKRGKLGVVIEGETVNQCLNYLPIYARTDKDKEFPKWKKKYIEDNRNFYLRNKSWLDKWIPKIEDFDNSFMKLEWNCGNDCKPILEDKIIQFRASGIRVKLPTFSPALNLVGTQIPIFPWVELPKSVLSDGEPTRGRYMTIKESAAIQGMMSLNFNTSDPNFPLKRSRIAEALGNAVNVTIVKHIAKKLIHE